MRTQLLRRLDRGLAAILRKKSPMNGHRSAIRCSHSSHEAGKVSYQLVLLVAGHRWVEANAVEIIRDLQTAAGQVYPGDTRFSTPHGQPTIPERHEPMTDGGIFTRRITFARFPTNRRQLRPVTQDQSSDLRQRILECPVVHRSDQRNTIRPVSTSANAAA